MRPLPCGPQQDVAESSPGKFLLQGRLDAKTLRPRWEPPPSSPGPAFGHGSCDQNPDHAACTLLRRKRGFAASAESAQTMISSLPSMCSATAVQLSTQSPQLT
jgi:hypothetical protein